MSTISCLAWVPKGVTSNKPNRLKLNEEELAKLLENDTPGPTGSDDESHELDDVSESSDDESESSDDDQVALKAKKVAARKKKDQKARKRKRDSQSDSDDDENGTSHKAGSGSESDTSTDDSEDNIASEESEEDASSDQESGDVSDQNGEEADSEPEEEDGEKNAASEEEKGDPDGGEDSAPDEEEGGSGEDTDPDEQENPLKKLVVFTSNKKDPYLTAEASDEDSDVEILPEDNLLAVGKVSHDYDGLELHVYNEGDGSFYCHDNVILGGSPLALEWVGYDPGEDAPGNLLALGGTFPGLQLWDADVMDSMEPAFTMGNKRGRKRARTEPPATLALAWNKLQPRVLASGATNGSVKLWDLAEGAVVTRLAKHKDKVQTLAWHPCEHQMILSGSADSLVRLHDCTYTEATHRDWQVKGEVERVAWNPHSPYCMLASTDSGHIFYLDVRTEEPVWRVRAHKGAVTGLAFSTHVPGLVASASTDGRVKLWDLRRPREEGKAPKSISEQRYGIGEVLCLMPSPDSGFIFAVSGHTDVKVVSVRELAAVQHYFKEHVGAQSEGGATSAQVPLDQETSESDSDAGDYGRGSSKSSKAKPVKKNKKKTKKKKRKPKKKSDDQ